MVDGAEFSATSTMVAGGILGGIGVQFKVRGNRRRRSAVVDNSVEPGVIVEPHRHQHEDELSYVLEGTIWARGRGEGDGGDCWVVRVEAQAGVHVGTPVPNLPAFSRSSHWLGSKSSSNSSAILLQSEPPSEEDIAGLCDRYGLDFDHSWLPDLQARFGPLRVV